MIEIEANRNMLFDYNNYSTDLNFRKDKFTRGVFEGVYHADKLAASIPKLSARYIANVDRSEKPVGWHFISPRARGRIFLLLWITSEQLLKTTIQAGRYSILSHCKA